MAAPCGTYARYQAHRLDGEQACTECKAAAAAYAREYRRRTGQNYDRTYNKARHRALSRLADKHRAEFVALFAEERAKEVSP